MSSISKFIILNICCVFSIFACQQQSSNPVNQELVQAAENEVNTATQSVSPKFDTLQNVVNILAAKRPHLGNPEAVKKAIAGQPLVGNEDEQMIPHVINRTESLKILHQKATAEYTDFLAKYKSGELNKDVAEAELKRLQTQLTDIESAIQATVEFSERLIEKLDNRIPGTKMQEVSTASQVPVATPAEGEAAKQKAAAVQKKQ